MLKKWLKQHKAAPALDFPYFQSVSILAVQDKKYQEWIIPGTFYYFSEGINWAF